MRKKLLGLFVIFCIPIPLLAQDSVGFSDPDNIQPLLDYRLPEWGYTNFFLDFSTDGVFRKNKSSLENSSDTDNIFSGHLSPHYIRYRESESRVSDYSLRPRIDYSFRNQTSYSNDEDIRDNLELYLFWVFNEKIYLADSDIFLTGIFSGFFNQHTLWEKEESQSTVEIDRKLLHRNFNPTLSIGIGYGRLRTVNPMIRSLRLNERLTSLDTGQNMNQKDIISAADHFTRLSGYQQSFDRPQKYFWEDMDEQLSTDLSALNPFDLLYLTDVTSEALGFRQQGWQVSATINLQHHVDYSHQGDNTGSTSNISTSTFLSPTIKGIWYKNLSLRHQIGAAGSFLYQKELDDDSLIDDNNLLNLSANWLYTITDRLLINNSVSYFRIGRDQGPSSLMTFRSNADYYIENSFSLFVNIEYVYNWDSTQVFTDGSLTESIDERDIRFSTGLRYYLKRGLF